MTRPKLRHCRFCDALHPESAFHRYGGTSPHSSDLRTYCKQAQYEMNLRRRVLARGEPYAPGRYATPASGTPYFTRLMQGA